MQALFIYIRIPSFGSVSDFSHLPMASTRSPAPVIVLDTAALIAGTDNLFSLGGLINVDTGSSLYSPSSHEVATFYTIPEVIQEVRDPRARARLALLRESIKLRAPSSEALAATIDFSKRTGDFAVLSLTDLKVIALTRMLERELNGDMYLKSAPPQRKISEIRIGRAIPFEELDRIEEEALQRQRERQRQGSSEGPDETLGELEWEKVQHSKTRAQSSRSRTHKKPSQKYVCRVEWVDGNAGPNLDKNMGKVKNERKDLPTLENESRLSACDGADLRKIEDSTTDKKTESLYTIDTRKAWEDVREQKEEPIKPSSGKRGRRRRHHKRKKKADPQEIAAASSPEQAEVNQKTDETGVDRIPADMDLSGMETEKGTELAEILVKSLPQQEKLIQNSDKSNLHKTVPENMDLNVAETRKKAKRKDLAVEPSPDQAELIQKNDETYVHIPVIENIGTKEKAELQEIPVKPSPDQAEFIRDGDETDIHNPFPENVDLSVVGTGEKAELPEAPAESFADQAELIQKSDETNMHNPVPENMDLSVVETIVLPEGSGEHGKHEELLSDEGDESEDDEAGWITEANLDEHLARDRGGAIVSEEDRKRVACVTTDFAMQSTMLQMGLKLLSVDGRRAIRKIKHFALRCQACGVVTTELERKFCSKCGNACMHRVAYRVSNNGIARAFLNPKKKPVLRGTKYPIPMPRGGRHNKDLILREDQVDPVKQRRLEKQRERLNVDVLDPTNFYNAGAKFNPHNKPMIVGYGRRNPNEVRSSRRKR